MTVREKGRGIRPPFFSFIALIFIITPLVFFGGLPSDQIFLGVTIVLCIAFFALQKDFANTESLGLPWVYIPLVASFSYLLVSPFFVSQWPWISLWMGGGLLMLPLAFLATLLLPQISLARFLLAFVTAVSVNALAVVWLSFNQVHRPAGFLPDANLAGNIFALGFMASLYLVHVQKKWQLVIFQLLLATALFLTLSRGAFFALLGAVCIFVVLCKLKALRVKPVVIAVSVVFVMAFLIAESIKTDSVSVASLNPQSRPASMENRVKVWEKSWELFRENPVWGTGLGSFSLRYPAVRAKTETTTAGNFAHNDYLQLLIELGWVGTLCFLLLPLSVFVFCFLGLRHTREKESVFLFAFSISVALLIAAHAFFNFIVYHPIVVLFLGGVLGFSVRSYSSVRAVFSSTTAKTLKTTYPRLIFSALFLLLGTSLVVDVYGRSVIFKAQSEGDAFNLESETYYQLLPLSYLSPLNVEMRNLLVLAQLNTAMNLYPSKMANGLFNEIKQQISRDSWLQEPNCSQTVNNARIMWMTDKEGAIETLRALLEKAPHCIQGRITLADAYIELGSFQNAIALLNRGVDRFRFKENRGRGPVVLVETLIEAYERSGDERSAMSLRAYLRAFKEEQDAMLESDYGRRINLLNEK